MVDINRIAAGNYWNHMGLSLIVKDEAAYVTMKEMTETTQVYGNIHGGAVAGLIDASIAIAINNQLPLDQGAYTIEMKVNYLLPAKGELIAKGSILKKGNKIIVGQSEVTNSNGEIIAIGIATFMAINSNVP
ncbi:MAG: PaaI family thioesterase [Bacillota bacterium]|nr:PaaI family thioesterase [Bacillota bacterium]